MKWHFQRESSYVSSNLLLLSIQLKKPRSPGACQLLALPSAPTTMLSISRMAQGRLGLSTNQGQHQLGYLMSQPYTFMLQISCKARSSVKTISF